MPAIPLRVQPARAQLQRGRAQLSAEWGERVAKSNKVWFYFNGAALN